MQKLLYLYEERHPTELRDFIRAKIRLESLNFEEASYSDSKQSLIEKFKSVDAVLMAPGRFLEDEIHKAGEKIKLIQLWSSGYDKINLNACNKFNQKVANNGGANAQSVAEHTFLLILSAARRLTEMHDRVINANWTGNGHGLNLQSLFGKRLGLIGMGNIGSKVAEIGSAFKMEVQYFDPFITLKSNKNFRKVDLSELVQNSDFISLHTHAVKNSKPILSQTEFDIMRPGINIVNTSRAELIDYVALQKSLKSGFVRYYAADVFLKEPTTGNEEELAFRNTTFTPHIAGSNVETYEIALGNCIANIKRAFENKKILWEVSKF
jgi:lactate dehydrogenase-like 2-hydroxyacid dehydrogenase